MSRIATLVLAVVLAVGCREIAGPSEMEGRPSVTSPTGADRIERAVAVQDTVYRFAGRLSDTGSATVMLPSNYRPGPNPRVECFIGASVDGAFYPIQNGTSVGAVCAFRASPAGTSVALVSGVGPNGEPKLPGGFYRIVVRP